MQRAKFTGAGTQECHQSLCLKTCRGVVMLGAVIYCQRSFGLFVWTDFWIQMIGDGPLLYWLYWLGEAEADGR